MFVVRQAKPRDVGALVKLARMVYFVNLPADERLLSEKINHSVRCFRRAAGGSEPANISADGTRRKSHEIFGLAQMDQESDLFIFVIEDQQTAGVIGTCQIRARQGGPGNPNWSFQLAEKSFFSTTLGYGSTHTVGRLYGDESGPTEIGGLILQPSFRGHGQKPGRLLSFTRFNFIACHRHLFADRVLAEMMAPVTADGDSLFWDHLGRKFIPVKYAEADRFCQFNRRFIPELFPKEEIYLTLFPLEVQNQLATVSKETIPARRMLESIGFRYRGHIDPFDGGPHLDADTDSITLVRDTQMLEVARPIAAARCRETAIVSLLSPEGEFRAVDSPVERSERSVRVPEGVMEVLGAAPGGRVGVTPLTPVAPPSARRTRSRKRSNT